MYGAPTTVRPSDPRSHAPCPSPHRPRALLRLRPPRTMLKAILFNEVIDAPAAAPEDDGAPGERRPGASKWQLLQRRGSLLNEMEGGAVR